MVAWLPALDRRASKLHTRQIMKRLWHTSWVLLAVLILGSTASRPAVAAESWVGKRVIQKYSDFELRVGTKVVDRKRLIEIYSVEKQNDSWIWLRADRGELRGWAR